MRKRYPIKGSNILYKIWGIIVLVFAMLAGVLYLSGFICLLVSPANIPDFLPYLYSTTDLGEALSDLIVRAATDLLVQISVGVILVKDYVESKNAVKIFAGILFVRALVGFLGMILYSMTLVSATFLLSSLFVIGWNVTTGVILISKLRKIYMPRCGKIEGKFGEFKGKQIYLDLNRVYKIGQETKCDIQLMHPNVSRVHCTICMMPYGKYQITDCSYNGTFYENQRLPKNIMQEVEPGGMLVIGETDNVLMLK